VGLAVRFAGVVILPGEMLYADQDGTILADQPLI
jgi:regulator of RNase E activity RraA